MSKILNLTEENINNFYEEIINTKNDVINKITSSEKINHLEKIIFWSNILLLFAIFTIWIPYNIFGIISLSLFIMARWTIVGHHVCHGGYDKCNMIQYNSKVFGIGSLYRKFNDWFDWFSIKAWKYEHNKFHHYYLNENNDPDLVENAFDKVNNSLFYLIASIFTWRWSYYASNTFVRYYINKYNTKYPNKYIYNFNEMYTIFRIFNLRFDVIINFIKSILPYFAVMFLIIPLIYSMLFNSIDIGINVLINIF